MYDITIYGQAYETAGDGGDLETSITISDEEYEEIKAIADEQECDINDLSVDDLPSGILQQMEDAVQEEAESYGDDWGCPIENISSFVSGFSIDE